MPTAQFLNFADSEVASIEFADGRTYIRFSAAHITQNDPANQQFPSNGFARFVELILATSKFDSTATEYIGRISNGRVRIQNQWIQQMPLPCLIIDSVILDLTFANQSHLEIEATSLECRYTGEPNFFESMAC